MRQDAHLIRSIFIFFFYYCFLIIFRFIISFWVTFFFFFWLIDFSFLFCPQGFLIDDLSVPFDALVPVAHKTILTVIINGISGYCFCSSLELNLCVCFYLNFLRESWELLGSILTWTVGQKDSNLTSLNVFSYTS